MMEVQDLPCSCLICIRAGKHPNIKASEHIGTLSCHSMQIDRCIPDLLRLNVLDAFKFQGSGIYHLSVHVDSSEFF